MYDTPRLKQRLAFIAQELAFRIIEHKGPRAPDLSALISESEELCQTLGIRRRPLTIEPTESARETILAYRFDDPLSSESVYVMTYYRCSSLDGHDARRKGKRRKPTPGDSVKEGIHKNADAAEIERMSNRWKRAMLETITAEPHRVPSVEEEICTPTVCAERLDRAPGLFTQWAKLHPEIVATRKATRNGTMITGLYFRRVQQLSQQKATRDTEKRPSARGSRRNAQ